MGSKHAFHQESRSTEEAEAAIAKFVGISSEKLPVTRTIDDVLKRLDCEEMNVVLMQVFEVLRKDKLFASHPELIPGRAYHLAIDAECTHKYTPNSSHNPATCPFCLKRQRGEEVLFLHMHVVASIVCPGSLRIPIYVYPIHAKSLDCKETDSQEKFKQECELAAFPVVLGKIRERFPKLNFCILVDSLYANAPAIKILQKHHMEFMIVRKNGSMSTVGKDCDGLMQLQEHKAACQTEENLTTGGKKIKRSYCFFNKLDYQDLKINLLRFEERVFDEDGNEISYVYWEWIVSFRITKSNVFLTASRGRMRWLEEDLFNTLKNRGFNIRHDYSRDSTAQVVWTILIMLAFVITEFFELLKSIIPIKKNRTVNLKSSTQGFFIKKEHQKPF